MSDCLGRFKVQNPKGGMRFAFPPYGLFTENRKQKTVLFGGQRPPYILFQSEL